MPKITIPTGYLCAATQQVMITPVLLADGYIYEYQFIQGWLKKHNTSPLTLKYLLNKICVMLTPLQEEIAAFVTQNKLCTQQEFLQAYHHSNLIMIEQLPFADSFLKIRDQQGNTLLHLAVDQGQVDKVIWLFLYQADLEAKNNQDETPLHRAIVRGHTEIVELLLVQGANIEAKSLNDMRPLHIAAWYGQGVVITLLLTKGADVYATTSQGHTALHFATNNGHQHIIEQLVTFGAAQNALYQNKQTLNPIEAEQGHLTIANPLNPLTKQPLLKKQKVTPDKIAELEEKITQQAILISQQEQRIKTLEIQLNRLSKDHREPSPPAGDLLRSKKKGISSALLSGQHPIFTAPTQPITATLTHSASDQQLGGIAGLIKAMR